MEIFDNDDNEYFKWMNYNPESYVVNTFRSRNTQFSLLHRVGCRHISNESGYDKGAYTERDYIKVCSNDLGELKDWFVKNYPKFRSYFKECKTCCPTLKK
jgi:hypothetical protein